MQKTVTAAALAAILALGVSAFAKDGPEGAKVGEKAPAFELKDLDGNAVSLEKVLEQKKIVVLEWFNPGCPVVKDHHGRKTMKTLAEKYKEQVVWLAINSSAEGKQGYGVEMNQEAKKRWELGYPVLLDSDGKVGRQYGAKTTPHMYVINAEGVLVYAGAIDNAGNRSTPPETKVNYVEAAVEALLAGKAVEVGRTKPYGCSVKYAPLNK